MFCALALGRIKLGFKHYSADAIFHRIRWEMTKPEYKEGEEFKINNNYTSVYARGFMNKYPEHAGFFRLREQSSKNDKASNRPPLGPKDYKEEQANE